MIVVEVGHAHVIYVFAAFIGTVSFCAVSCVAVTVIF
jgi:hypothetical protein